MQASKSRFGLTDLKRLRRQAEQSTAEPKPAGPGKAGSGNKASPPAGKAASACDVPLTAQDLALFQQAVKTVQRIDPAGRQVLRPQPQASAHELRERRLRAAGDDAKPSPSLSQQYAPAGLDQDDSTFRKPTVGPDVVRDLQRGKWPASASLDLHGATQDQAWERLSAFLKSCVEHQIRCVRIVHGKGYGSRDGMAILKQTVRRWLAQWPEVQAYVECAERDGGAGAVQVLLANSPRQT